VTDRAYIVHHDCRVDTHGAHVIGPFPDWQAANAYIAKHELDFPSDGGYAFALVVTDRMNAISPDDYRDEDDEESDPLLHIQTQTETTT
jgi:hypothetical protein